ncbi:hypothetical protein B0T26DRAFT_679211 [Lasiosphaeria miniovina]|uniref:Uncharacterized protein n=1 Tax=Lasiosphaeria miniovina TaxID=1954250 RepID=A0AA40A5U4_9PEZI|nr:uncharacterized protein B0T26DRAFT_679211 [Lasiosphaeria miniovina]KAK0709847.1 hypothetical protein B0T26DRAFT_679211 [Lasiosphaeria miniovina]
MPQQLLSISAMLLVWLSILSLATGAWADPPSPKTGGYLTAAEWKPFCRTEKSTGICEGRGTTFTNHIAGGEDMPLPGHGIPVQMAVRNSPATPALGVAEWKPFCETDRSTIICKRRSIKCSPTGELLMSPKIDDAWCSSHCACREIIPAVTPGVAVKNPVAGGEDMPLLGHGIPVKMEVLDSPATPAFNAVENTPAAPAAPDTVRASGRLASYRVQCAPGETFPCSRLQTTCSDSGILVAQFEWCANNCQCIPAYLPVIAERGQIVLSASHDASPANPGRNHYYSSVTAKNFPIDTTAIVEPHHIHINEVNSLAHPASPNVQSPAESMSNKVARQVNAYNFNCDKQWRFRKCLGRGTTCVDGAVISNVANCRSKCQCLNVGNA